MTYPTSVQQYAQAYANLTGTIPSWYTNPAEGTAGHITLPKNSALAEYETAESDAATDQTSYLKELDKIGKSKNPSMEMYLLLALLMSGGSDVLSDQMGKRGAQLQVELDVNKCNTSLLSMTNDTTTAAGSGGKGLLDDFAHGTEDMLTLCQGSSLDDTLGSAATTSLGTNFKTLRDMVFTGGAIAGDPTTQDTPSAYFAQGTYFDTRSSTFSGSFDSFAAMHAAAATQGSSGHASGAETAISTNFGTNGSLLSGVQAQVNTMLGQIKNAISTIQSFASDMGHSLSTVNSLAIQNQTRG